MKWLNRCPPEGLAFEGGDGRLTRNGEVHLLDKGLETGVGSQGVPSRLRSKQRKRIVSFGIGSFKPVERLFNLPRPRCTKAISADKRNAAGSPFATALAFALRHQSGPKYPECTRGLR